jgi:secreted trypsin-like serine protease
MMLFFYLLCILLPISTFTHKQSYSCSKNAPCGCSGRVTVTKIVDGERVNKRSWGWMVSLRHYSNHTHFCGGSIITNAWILTAAHCLSGRDPSEILIYAGSNNLQHPSQKRTIGEIFLHENFNLYILANDIALIRLSSPLNMNSHALAKICLPPKRGKTLRVKMRV